MGYGVIIIFGALFLASFVVGAAMINAKDSSVRYINEGIVTQGENTFQEAHTQVEVTGVGYLSAGSGAYIYVENTGDVTIDPDTVWMTLDDEWISASDYSMTIIDDSGIERPASEGYWEPSEILNITYSQSIGPLVTHTFKVGASVASGYYYAPGITPLFLKDDGTYDSSDPEDILTPDETVTLRVMTDGPPTGGDFDNDGEEGTTIDGGQDTSNPLQYQDFLSEPFVTSAALSGQLNVTSLWIKPNTPGSKDGWINLTFYEYVEGPVLTEIASIWYYSSNWGGGSPGDYFLTQYSFSTDVDYTISAGSRLLLRITTKSNKPQEIHLSIMYDSIDSSTQADYRAYVELPVG